MAEPTLNDVIDRLDKLETVLQELTSAVRDLESGTSVPAAASGPPKKVTQPPPKAPVETAPDPAPAPSFGAPGVEASVRDLVVAVFEAVLIEDIEESWEALTALTHSDEVVAPRAIDHLKAFSWKKLRRGADRYLAGGAPDKFEVVRTVPAEITKDVDTVKFFLQPDKGGAAPITLRRDSVAEGAWRVSQISL